MAPLSKSDTGREQSIKNNDDIFEISEKLQKIGLETTQTKEEQCTYDINDEDDIPNEKIATKLEDCTTIVEKGTDKLQKSINIRQKPYARPSTSGVTQFFNQQEENIINDVIIQNFDVNQGFSFNNIQFNDNNGDFLYNFDEQTTSTIPINENVIDYLQSNIPTTIEQNFSLTTSSNVAEKKLSNYIDKNKQLKQKIWIKVNIEDEQILIEMLRGKIAAAPLNLFNLNFIYAIIIRLMKEEDRTLLRGFFATDNNILFNIALKRNILLMDFILEVYQNLGFNPIQVDLLHQIVDYSHIDLCEMFEHLLNKMFDNKPMNMCDVNVETILLIVQKNISNNKGLPEINAKYFELVLKRKPDINYVANEAKNIVEGIDWGCPEKNPAINLSHTLYNDYNEWKSYDYNNKYQYQY